MHVRWTWLLIGLMLVVPLYAATVKGVIVVRDENSKPRSARVPGLHRVLYTASDVAGRACGEAVVTNDLEVAELEIGVPCDVQHLQAELILNPDDLTVSQDPRPTVVPSCSADHCEYVLTLKWPRKKSREQRQAYFEKGQEALSTSSPTAAAYLAEASWGDVEFTAAAVGALEKQGNYAGVVSLLEGTDVASLETDDRTRFKLLMREANAASAIRRPNEALKAATSALEIFPRNEQAPAVALRTLAWSANSYDAARISDFIESNERLEISFKRLYLTWEAKGKPQPTFGKSISDEVGYSLKRLDLATPQ